MQKLLNHTLSGSKKIEIAAYDPNWPNIFDIEAGKIKTALGSSLIEIHHIGSTAVAGLAAKPTIDIIACVKNDNSSLLPYHPEFSDRPASGILTDLKRVQHDLKNIGYKFKGEFNIPLRWFFSKNTSESKVNLHVTQNGSNFMDLQLAFRDYLRQNEQARNEYAQLKYEIIKNSSSAVKLMRNFNMPKYTLIKNDFIKDILAQAGFDKLNINFCLFSSEWIATKSFRNKYFFKQNKIEDPYTWSFDHKDHKHFILYKGVDIIGYAHVQLLPETRTSYLRIIFIDETHQGKGYGKEMIALIHKWLQLQGYKSIHIELSPSNLDGHARSLPVALKFFHSAGYVQTALGGAGFSKSCQRDIVILYSYLQ